MFDDLDLATQLPVHPVLTINSDECVEGNKESSQSPMDTSSGVANESTQTMPISLATQELSHSFQYHTRTVREKLSEYMNVYNSFLHADLSQVDTACIICMSWAVECIFIPCGHACCCRYCLEFSSHRCPICRSEIKDFLMLPCEGANREEL